jgi:anti-sigma regulatory factor (Ser/Thr protein kinase)
MHGVVSPDDDREPDVRYRIEHDPGAPGDARREVDQLLSGPGDPIAEDVWLATSELVTNVVVHTEDGGELRAWDPRPDVPLRIEVEDPDPGVPAIPSEPPGIGGRGLGIVDAVADDWGVEPRDDGKVVWAEFDRNQRQSSETDQ